MSILEEIYNIWQNDLQLREEFKTNPEEAVKKILKKLEEKDIVISDEELAKIKSLLKKLKNDNSQNEELDERINK